MTKTMQIPGGQFEELQERLSAAIAEANVLRAERDDARAVSRSNAEEVRRLEAKLAKTEVAREARKAVGPRWQERDGQGSVSDTESEA